MKFLLPALFIFCLSCIGSSTSYKKCERAESEYLVCSLVFYQNYTFCSEFASAGSKPTEQKAAEKFNCDATRIIGLSFCDQIKKDACGTAK
ncbi:MAG: hypothetical protein O9301_13935 [Leptospira sp.]|nr:hypothetical protein [Leptospira sp.]